jgi:hypothetical protein
MIDTLFPDSEDSPRWYRRVWDKVTMKRERDQIRSASTWAGILMVLGGGMALAGGAASLRKKKRRRKANVDE